MLKRVVIVILKLVDVEIRCPMKLHGKDVDSAVHVFSFVVVVVCLLMKLCCSITNARNTMHDAILVISKLPKKFLLV